MINIVEADGTFVGAWNDQAAAQVALDQVKGRQIVPTAPDDARQKWNGAGYDPAPAPVGDPLALYLVALGTKAGIAPPAVLVAQANPVAVVQSAPAVPGIQGS